MLASYHTVQSEDEEGCNAWSFKHFTVQNQFVKETVCRIQFAILLWQRFMGLLPIVKVCDVKEVFLHQFLFSV
jgi:hypothetical protein